MSSIDHLVRNAYAPAELEEQAMLRSPTLGLLRKGMLASEHIVVTLEHRLGGTRSKTMSKAIANVRGSNGIQLTITPSEDFAIGALRGKQLRIAQKAGEAYVVNLIEKVMRDPVKRIVQKIGKDVLGDGSSSLGTIQSIDTLTVYVTDMAAIAEVREGDRLVSASSTSAALNDSANPVCTVQTVNRALPADGSYPSFTVDRIPTGMTTNHILWKEGDYLSAGDRLALMGLGGWVPVTMEGGTFFGASRLTDPVTYAGQRIDMTGKPILEAVVRLVRAATLYGDSSGLTCILASEAIYERIHNRLRSQAGGVGTIEIPAQIVDGDGNSTPSTTIGYKGLQFAYGDVVCPMILEKNLPASHMRAFNQETFRLDSTGTMPDLLKYGDSGAWVVDQGDDAAAFRVGYTAALYAEANVWDGNAVAYNVGL